MSTQHPNPSALYSTLPPGPPAEHPGASPGSGTASPFLQHFFVAQQLSLDLQKETNGLERTGAAYLSQLRASDLYGGDGNGPDGELDLESGGGKESNPLLKKMATIGNLIQRARAAAYQAERYAETQIERTKLGQIERRCTESEQLLHRFRQRLHERRRQLETDSYLFGPKRSDAGAGGGGRGLMGANPGYSDADIDSAGAQEKALIGGSAGYFGHEQDLIQGAMKTVHGTLSDLYSSVDSLDRQRELFMGIQRKTADIASQLGLSNDVIGWIARQENTNTIITIVGMVLTVFIIIVFYCWWNARG